MVVQCNKSVPELCSNPREKFLNLKRSRKGREEKEEEEIKTATSASEIESETESERKVEGKGVREEQKSSKKLGPQGSRRSKICHESLVNLFFLPGSGPLELSIPLGNIPRTELEHSNSELGRDRQYGFLSFFANAVHSALCA